MESFHLMNKPTMIILSPNLDVHMEMQDTKVGESFKTYARK